MISLSKSLTLQTQKGKTSFLFWNTITFLLPLTLINIEKVAGRKSQKKFVSNILKM
jgi:hypothetical protein